MGAIRVPGLNQALNLSLSLTFTEGDMLAELTTRRSVTVGATESEEDFRPFRRTAQVESRTVLPPLLQNAPFGGRISLALRSWSQLTEDKWVLDIVKNGHLIEFMEMSRFIGLTKTPLKKRKMANILWKEVHSLMAKDAIEYVSPEHQNEGFYSRFFLVKNKPDGLRPILNLRPLNQLIKKQIQNGNIVVCKEGREEGRLVTLTCIS